jgi:Zn-dependent protease
MTDRSPTGPDDSRSDASRGSRQAFGEPVRAELVMAGNADDVIRSVEDVADINRPRDRYLGKRKRRVLLPVLLFLATCLSTFWVGTTFLVENSIVDGARRAGNAAVDEAIKTNPALAGDKNAQGRIEGQASFAYLISHNYPSGLTYMSAVIGILLCHEMGHFLQAMRHRIPASLPFFIPIPIAPIGTMGAVIGMEGMRANRRELFDIGVSGPIAGLIVAIPLTWIGVQTANIEPIPSLAVAHANGTNLVQFDKPWILAEMEAYLHPAIPEGMQLELNALTLAGWVGMFITGLNMMPVSQLDGGHVIYSLFGRRLAHLIAKLFVIVAISYIVIADATIWIMMLTLVILIGVQHPPTADDTAELSLPQKIVGYASLAIPFLCFPPRGITFQ